MTAQADREPAATDAAGGAPKTKRTRYPELDVVRVIACVAVVLWHFTFSSWASVEQPTPGLRYEWLSGFTRHFFVAPQVFFFISGFVIVGAAQSTTAAAYLRDRVLRVVPMFWLMCTATWLVSRNDDVFGPLSTTTLVLNLTFLTSFAGGPFVDAVYWTLTVEIAFYGLIWLVMCARRLHQIKGFMLWWLGVGLAIEAVATGHDGALGHLGFLMRWSACFAAGICCWLLSQDRHDRFARRLLPVLAVLVARSIWLVADQFEAHLLPGVRLDPWIGIGIALACLGGLAALAVHGPTRLVDGSSVALWSTLGALTYPVYLLHENVGLIAMDRLDHIDRWILLPGTCAAVVAVSWGALVWYEKPVMRWLRRRIPR